jgi:hypothetical protein
MAEMAEMAEKGGNEAIQSESMRIASREDNPMAIRGRGGEVTLRRVYFVVGGVIQRSDALAAGTRR